MNLLIANIHSTAGPKHYSRTIWKLFYRICARVIWLSKLKFCRVSINVAEKNKFLWIMINSRSNLEMVILGAFWNFDYLLHKDLVPAGLAAPSAP